MSVWETKHRLLVEQLDDLMVPKHGTNGLTQEQATRLIDAGTAAECLCPAVTFHVDRDHARHHLTQHPELHDTVLDHQDAIEIARLSFSSLLTE